MSELSTRRVRDLMSREVATLDVTATLAEAYEDLLAQGIHGAPVLEPDGALAGVVSGSDLLMALAPVLDPQAEDDVETLAALRRTPLRELMASRVATCGPDATVQEACALMARRDVRRLVVLEDGAVVGVLSAIDVVRAVAAG